MKRMSHWGIFVFLLVLASLLFSTGVDLRSIGPTVDGAGIGVYFMFFEIDDRVPAHSIPMYANGFFVASLVIAVAALLGFLRTFKKASY